MRGLPWSRRRFVGASVAAVCVGCSSDPDDTTTVSVRANAVGLDDLADSSLPVDVTPPALGGPIDVGSLDDVRAASEPLYVPAARAYVVTLTAADAAVVAAEADDALLPGLALGLLALSQRCPHLGCRVPFCASSGWFECFCHGSMFNRAGEHRGGPGPRGLDAMPIVVDGDRVAISPSRQVEGAPMGSIVLDQEAEGPHCTDGVEH